MEEKKGSKSPKSHFYLKWPWNVLVYILLVIVLRIFAIPVILLIMRWNKKQQPDGPAEGYCLQRTRGRLIQLLWAAIILLAVAALSVYLVTSWMEGGPERGYTDYIIMIVGGMAVVGGLLIAIYEAYTGVRDVFCPEKSRLAQSIRNQLTYPEEAPPVKELFAMVDEDIRRNGQWFGNLAVGEKWILGDEVSYIPRIRGVFFKDEIRTHHSNGQLRSSRIMQLWIVDDRQNRQLTDFKSPKALKSAFEFLQKRVPAAVFGLYDSREYKALAYANEDEWYEKDRAYRQKTAQLQEEMQKEQERQSQNQVLTMPDGSVTSRITGDSLSQLLLQCRRQGESRSFQLVPGIPFQGEGRVFSRLVCFPGEGSEPVRIFVEEYSGSPSEPGIYGWSNTMTVYEAETLLRAWLRGQVPSLNGWDKMERTSRGWAQALSRS